MLTGKQRSFLRGLGNGAAVVLQVGKGNLSDAVLKQAEDALEARELIKVRVLKACSDTPAQIAEQLAAGVHAEVVQVLGRNFLLYRKSGKELIELP